VSKLLQQLNIELSDVIAHVRLGLVEIQNGRRGVGAGTIWHPEGLIVTNAHVAAARRDGLRVTLADGRSLSARLLARDADLDLAALKVDASSLPTIEIGHSKRLNPGQWVMALGHPWGVPGAVSSGVVIGIGPHPEGIWPGRDLVQVNLPLRPGHSGGPLVDAHGRLIGINTMMNGPEVGLAVPVHEAKRFLREALGT
jgi:S1-C subfamily serine protease